jgi:hypothetical protein
MSLGAYLGIAVVVTFLGLVLLSSGTTAREGSYRRGVGWYADMSTPSKTLMGQSAIQGPRTVEAWKITLWLVAGIAAVGGAIVAWPIGEPGLAGLLAFFGLALIGLAWDGRRRNRQAERHPRV